MQINVGESVAGAFGKSVFRTESDLRAGRIHDPRRDGPDAPFVPEAPGASSITEVPLTATLALATPDAGGGDPAGGAVSR